MSNDILDICQKHICFPVFINSRYLGKWLTTLLRYYSYQYCTTNPQNNEGAYYWKFLVFGIKCTVGLLVHTKYTRFCLTSPFFQTFGQHQELSWELLWKYLLQTRCLPVTEPAPLNH